MAIEFICSKCSDEKCVMYSKIDNVEIVIDDDRYEVVEEFFQSPLSRNQIGLETSMKGSDFVLDWAHLFYYKYNKTSPSCGGPYIDSQEWMKIKKNKKDSSPTKS